MEKIGKAVLILLPKNGENEIEHF
jgi:hypothetical protein